MVRCRRKMVRRGEEDGEMEEEDGEEGGRRMVRWRRKMVRRGEGGG